MPTIFEVSQVVVYEKTKDGWQIVKAFDFELLKELGLGAVRKKMNDLIESLGSCKTIMGKSITGVPYNVLDSAKISIFEMTEDCNETLDFVQESIEQCIEEERLSSNTLEEKVDYVEDRGNGNYFIDLEQLQKHYPNVSSKKALIPFLNQMIFHELEIVCNHIPPWIEGELSKLNLKGEVTALGSNAYKMLVYKKPCSFNGENSGRCEGCQK